MVDEEYLQDLYYVDYCNNCKDLEIMDPNEVPCHHSWYCWHDNGEVQQLEYELGLLKEKKHWNGRLTSQEYAKYRELKKKKFRLVTKKLKEYRRNNR